MTVLQIISLKFRCFVIQRFNLTPNIITQYEYKKKSFVYPYDYDYGYGIRLLLLLSPTKTYILMYTAQNINLSNLSTLNQPT